MIKKIDITNLKLAEEVLNIQIPSYKVMVHPKHFKKGIAKMLLDFIENDNEGFETLIVSTESKNTPAVTFYLKNGFSKTIERSITERLSITSFKKEI